MITSIWSDMFGAGFLVYYVTAGQLGHRAGGDGLALAHATSLLWNSSHGTAIRHGDPAGELRLRAASRTTGPVFRVISTQVVLD